MIATRVLLTIITAAFVMAMGLTRPYHNWDMIGYVAAAFHKDGYRGTDLLIQTYSNVKKEVSPQMFEELTSKSDSYRNTVFQNPKALEQQIPFYSIRVAYVELIRLFSHTGISYAKASYIISAIFASLSVFVIAYLLIKIEVNIAMLPVIVFATGIFNLARNSTPDAIACFLALLCLVALFRKSKFALLISALLPLARTDFVLLTGLVAVYEFYRGKRAISVLVLAVAMLEYFIINRVNGNYGWLTIFNFTLIHFTPYPAELIPSSDPKDYIRPYLMAAYGLVLHPHFTIYALATFILLKDRKALRLRRELVALAVIPFGFVALHMLLFPTYMDRFFMFSAVLIFAWLLAQINSARSDLGHPLADKKNEKMRLDSVAQYRPQREVIIGADSILSRKGGEASIQDEDHG